MKDHSSSRVVRVSAALLVFSFLFFISSSAFAIQAAPFPHSEIQPNGKVITLQTRGDEHFNWTEDAKGYTVVKHNGWFEYAERGPSGHLVPNGMKVGIDNPQARGLQKRILPSQAVRAQSAKKVSSGSGSVSAQSVPPAGIVKNLVVMIRFANHTNRDLPSVSDVSTLFNATGGDPQLAPTGSVKDVYYENSYGQMTLNSDVNPGIGDWITVSQSEAYYANGQSGDSTLWQALKEALNQLDAVIDFKDYDTDNDGRIDSIAFIHSGYGAEWGGTDAYGTSSTNRIWSHRWAIQPQWNSNDGVSVYDYHISPGVWGTTGSAIGRIGVIAHETGHFFGLADHYDTNGGGEGIGSWGLMANSWDFNGSQYCPPHFSAWSKITLGWSTPTVISTPGQYVINQAETNAEIYRINTGFPSQEYLLIENRQNAGFDCTIPQGGLAIWHIDDSNDYNTEGYPGQAGWPGNDNHYKIALLQADGDYDLERGINRGDSGDMHHAAGVDAIGPGPGNYPNTDTYKNGTITQTGIIISDISASGPSMTFCLNGCTAPEPPNAPSALGASAASSSQINLNWADNSNDETGFQVQRSANGSTGWATVATKGANSTSHSDIGLSASTEYFYRVAATNAAGASGYSNTASATTDAPPPYVDYVAQSSSTSEGSVSGGYSNTHYDDGSVQSITEQQSGGNPRKRRSSLSHTWTFNIVAGNSTTLTANAWSGGSNDGDAFLFQYSADGSNWTNAFTVSSLSTSNTQVAALPGGLSGTVYVRVTDTDNTQGNADSDTVFVDHLGIRVDNTPVTPPAAPTSLNATASAYNRVNLSWNDVANDETGYEVQRSAGGSYSTVATLAAGSNSYSDNSVSASTSYNYRVRALKGTSTSAFSNVASVTTPDEPAGGNITLSANGYKVRGQQAVDLSWNGSSASNVEIRRDGNTIATTANDGAYTDDIGAKGGATYQYEICDAGTSNCSNTVTVIF